MASAVSCPRCHVSTSAEVWAHSVCPICLMNSVVGRLEEKSEQPETATEQVGPYRLIRPLGEGAMGVVYLARQEIPIERDVALKMIRRGLDTDSIVARFEAERQILSLMDHPSVATVFDGGAAPDGRPYFVMQLVEGVPITEFCNRRNSSLRERLELFMQVCEGVQHAHQKGIIHRDIKPSNVLVAFQDGKASPKIIDFGIAKAITPVSSHLRLATSTGQRVGTLEYMSPEQAAASADIDTRTDVYSLGMMLYVMLAGSLPFDFDELYLDGPDAVLRTIRDEVPPLPSKRLVVKGSDSPRVDPKQLRGDLDWIVSRALEKDRSRRYASASDLAADIDRHLRDQPVTARAPTTGYRIRKFVRRNKLQVVAASVTGIAVLGGLVAASIGLTRALEAERRAREAAVNAAQEAHTANTVLDLLVGVFQGADPNVARGIIIDPHEMLQRGAHKVLLELSDQPLIRARMMGVLGLIETNLGQYDEAKSLLTGAIAIRRVFGGTDSTIAQSFDDLGHLHMEMHHPELALEVYKEALEIRQRTSRPDDVDVASSLSNFGVALRDSGRAAESLPFLERALDIRVKSLPANQLRIAESHLNLANALSDLDGSASAVDHYKMALDIYDRLDPDNPDRALVLDDLGVAEAMSQNYEKALPLHQKALAVRRKVFPPRHPDIATSLINTANDLFELKRYGDARPLYEEAIDIYAARPELGRRDLGWAEGNLSSLLVAIGEPGESVRHLDRARKVLTALDGPDSGDLADILEYRAGALLAIGRPGDAGRASAEAARIREHLKHPRRDTR